MFLIIPRISCGAIPIKSLQDSKYIQLRAMCLQNEIGFLPCAANDVIDYMAELSQERQLVVISEDVPSVLIDFKFPKSPMDSNMNNPGCNPVGKIDRIMNPE